MKKYVVILILFLTGINSLTAELKTLMLDVKLPKKVSELNGWHGIRLLHKDIVARKCRLVFTRNFGENTKEEVYLLIKLINLRFLIKEDICSIDLETEGLDHLLYLAIERQNKYAAWAILFPLEHQGFNLEGNVLDIYDVKYLLPVINYYEKLRFLLTSKKRKYSLIVNSCFATQLTNNEDMSLEKTVHHLKNNELEDFANLLFDECSEMLKID
ncbi:MAG: hypothetical protein OEZ22_07780 [Spirochaetia bacterium]|nr:hypothetical protein [Spirochaetia bacterium]